MPSFKSGSRSRHKNVAALIHKSWLYFSFSFFDVTDTDTASKSGKEYSTVPTQMGMPAKSKLNASQRNKNGGETNQTPVLLN